MKSSMLASPKACSRPSCLNCGCVNGITAWVSPGVLAKQTGTGECPAYDVGPTGFVDIFGDSTG
jgi:hypothetical protein